MNVYYLCSMNLPLFIARHIYGKEKTAEKKHQVSRPAVNIATAGVAIGLTVMIVSVCVVLGFKHTVRDKVTGFGSHIVVSNFLTLQTMEARPVAVDDSMMNVLSKMQGVEHVQRYAYKQGILKTDSDFLGVMFKGVGPEFDSTFIHNNMVEGSIPMFSDEASGNKILVSKTMADQLKLKCGERIFAYFFDQQGVRARRFTIQGIYDTNLSQYDKTICFTDLYTAVKLNGWEQDQVSGAELSVGNFEQLDATYYEVIRKVNKTTDKYGETFTSQTIKESNPQIFSWLDLLDLNVWIILALMIAVSSVTMISGLLIIILERTQMIGILKALGARNKSIRHTFLWLSVFIIGRGMILGNILGIGLVTLQYATGLVKLDPATYYVSTVPVEFNWLLIALLNIATLLTSVFVLIAPSYLVSHIQPAKSMRYE